MNRTTAAFAIHSFFTFKQQMLHWANQYNICSFLDSNNYQNNLSTLNCVLAVNAVNTFQTNINKELQSFFTNINDWWFGHITYDYGTSINNINYQKTDNIGFEKLFFFQPETLIQLHHTEVVISCIHQNPTTVYHEIIHQQNIDTITPLQQKNIVQPKISQQNYLSIIQELQQHIQRGDCYEINFCQEFFATNAHINPLYVYHQLINISPNPFSCYYKNNNAYLMCASPERFIKKQQQTIFSQPIKGTSKRNLTNTIKDYQQKIYLQQSQKEKSENVMVVDLVRNDLSKICEPASVLVDELFGIYSFPQVHQMISTIKGTLKKEIGFDEIIQATFPMGSMTGAPNKK